MKMKMFSVHHAEIQSERDNEKELKLITDSRRRLDPLSKIPQQQHEPTRLWRRMRLFFRPRPRLTCLGVYGAQLGI